MLHFALEALGEASRLKIVNCLATGEKSVGVLAQMVKIPMANVSHHLGLLKAVRIVVDEKRGRFSYYKLDPQVCSVVEGELVIAYPDVGRVILKIKA